MNKLICCCCGSQTTGKQWFNRDNGYGLCTNCADILKEKETPENMKAYYGIDGIHYHSSDISVYEKLVNANIPLDNHESDLYALKTPESQSIINDYKYKSNVTVFISQIDGKQWYDIPFAYQPYWNKKGMQ